jgi:hypothetical protein
MKKTENPYSILVPYLPMDSFELLRARIVPEGGDDSDGRRAEGRRTPDGAPGRGRRRYRSNQ